MSSSETPAESAAGLYRPNNRQPWRLILPIRRGDGTRSGIPISKALADLLALIQLQAGATGNCRQATEASEVQILMNKVQILGPDGDLYQAPKPSMLTGR